MKELALDLAVVAAMTFLAYMKIVPSDVAVGTICSVVAARVALRSPPGGTGTPPAGGIAALAGGAIALLGFPLMRRLATAAIFVALVVMPGVALAQSLPEAERLSELAVSGEWLLFSALLAGLAVRLVKSERGEKLLGFVPRRARPWIAVALGLASGVLEAVSTGVPLRAAMIRGAMSAAVAIAGHELLIESSNGGAEVGE